ncbi:SurA N-terminal domain-containing protein [Coxiella burnetii]|uniref:SurA N-terminal domain-containing protein n=1 Tax=Coxiella burnetii TaxID=777 RepID=UPI00051F192C|nr:SurA N-terminal domain-containing protein [Coxiella burnetii]AIT63900.1 Peptidyl-prolyl cis-trans isomerase [Coxiella burnetii str. Namibia]
MLQNIHERVKGWIAGLILAVVSLSFVLWGVQYYLQSEGGKNKTVAKVNGEKISENELNVVFQRLQRAYSLQRGQTLVGAKAEALKEEALQDLIMNHVLLDSAEKMGFNISPAEINQIITVLPAFQENGKFSPQRFQQFLYENSLTSAQFVAQLLQVFLIQQVEKGITGSAFVLPNEIKNNYELINQARDFRYMIISSAPFLKESKVTPEMIADYYQKHRESFKAPEKLSIAYLLLSPEMIRQQVSVSDHEIKQYYESNREGKSFNQVKDQIKQSLLQQKINTLLTKKSDQLSTITYTNPTSLEPAARQLNLKINTTLLFSREGEKEGIAANPKIVAAAFSDDVLQGGNNSDVIELKDGSLVVLRVKDHQPSHVLPLKTVSLQIEHQLKTQLAQAKASLLAGEIQNEIHEGRSVESIAKANHLFWRNEKEVKRNNKSIPAAVMASAFSIPLKKDHSMTTTVLNNGDSAVVQLTAIKPANFKNITEKQKNSLENLLSTQLGNLEYQFYMQAARSRAKIKINSPS